MKVLIWFMVLTGMPAIMKGSSGQSSTSADEENLEEFEFYDRYKRNPLNIGQNNRRTRIQTKNKSKSKSGGYTYSASDSSTSNSNTSSGGVWKGNPDEYTIGGVLSGKSGVEHYFTRVLSVSIISFYFINTGGPRIGRKNGRQKTPSYVKPHYSL